MVRLIKKRMSLCLRRNERKENQCIPAIVQTVYWRGQGILNQTSTFLMSKSHGKKWLVSGLDSLMPKLTNYAILEQNNLFCLLYIEGVGESCFAQYYLQVTYHFHVCVPWNNDAFDGIIVDDEFVQWPFKKKKMRKLTSPNNVSFFKFLVVPVYTYMHECIHTRSFMRTCRLYIICANVSALMWWWVHFHAHMRAR